MEDKLIVTINSIVEAIGAAVTTHGDHALNMAMLIAQVSNIQFLVVGFFFFVIGAVCGYISVPAFVKYCSLPDVYSTPPYGEERDALKEQHSKLEAKIIPFGILGLVTGLGSLPFLLNVHAWMGAFNGKYALALQVYTTLTK